MDDNDDDESEDDDGDYGIFYICMRSVYPTCRRGTTAHSEVRWADAADGLDHFLFIALIAMSRFAATEAAFFLG